MSVSCWVAEARATLNHLAASLGIAPDRLPRGEGTDALVHRPAAADPARLARVTQGDLDRWFHRFGAALSIRCAISSAADVPETRSWIAEESDHDVRGLGEVLRYAAEYGAEMEVGFDLDKRELLAGLGRRLVAAELPESREARLLLFFSAERLRQILMGHDPRSFERDQPGAGPRPLLVLVAGASGRVQGPWVSVLGADHQETTDLAASLRARRSPTTLARARAVMAEHTNWEDRPGWLTPDYFRTEPEGEEELAPVRGALVRLENRLVVPYLANRTASEAEGPVSVFDGPERSLEVPVGNEYRSQQAYALFQWAYREPEAEPTRIEIVRRVVAARLPNRDTAFALLQSSGLELLKECEVQLRVLVDRNLVESFERRQDVARQVRDYVGRVAERVAKLTKEVVDNAYRTAGLLLGVLIAYLLKPDQGLTVLLVTSAFYVLYLLFVRYFYLGSIRREFEAEREAFEEEWRAIDGSGVVEVGTLARQVTDRETEFRRRFAVVSRIYLGLTGAAALFAVLWSLSHGGDSSPEVVRREALARHASVLEDVGYRDLRADLPDRHPPPPLTVGATGEAVVPDLTAVGPAGRLHAFELVPCEGIGDPEVLETLQRLIAAGKERNVRVELLVPRVCDGELGPDSLRAWIEGESLAVDGVWAD